MSELSAIGMMKDVAGALGMGIPISGRDNALNDQVGDKVVDTVECYDTNKWETGIKADGTWIIVEEYEDDATAKVGHAKWVESINTNPGQELTDVHTLAW